MFDPKPGEIYRHVDQTDTTVLVIGRDDEVSERIAPAVRCITYVDGQRRWPNTSIWLDTLHNNYTLEGLDS